MDPDSLKVLSAIDEFMSETMEAEGYTKMVVLHHNSRSDLPKPVSKQQDPESTPAPPMSKLPVPDEKDSIPNMWEKDDETQTE